MEIRSELQTRHLQESLTVHSGDKLSHSLTLTKPEADVIDSPENRHRIESAIQALDIFSPNHPNTRFRYSVHNDTGRIQVELYNYLTGESVQKIPSNKLLDYAARVQELSGLILEEHA
ncbi:MAG: flagellar protein FlaG [Leptonema sp. (in: Bacteria)]|nr:flagellar protein FlaG [Leptonema sp. (in: bacteria)]